MAFGGEMAQQVLQTQCSQIDAGEVSLCYDVID